VARQPQINHQNILSSVADSGYSQATGPNPALKNKPADNRRTVTPMDFDGSGLETRAREHLLKTSFPFRHSLSSLRNDIEHVLLSDLQPLGPGMLNLRLETIYRQVANFRPSILAGSHPVSVDPSSLVRICLETSLRVIPIVNPYGRSPIGTRYYGMTCIVHVVQSKAGCLQ